MLKFAHYVVDVPNSKTYDSKALIKNIHSYCSSDFPFRLEIGIQINLRLYPMPTDIILNWYASNGMLIEWFPRDLWKTKIHAGGAACNK